MADGDYERGRGREISAIAAELKRLRNGRDARCPSAAARSPVFVLNGWAASPHAWDLCRFARTRLFSYVEQLDGEPEKAIENVERCILVGWSMGGSSALRLAARWPEKVAGLVLIAATPRMMEEKESGWKGMSPRRLEALRYGVMMTHGEGFFGVPEGKPNPYCVDSDENLARGLKYLLETDVRPDLERVFVGGASRGWDSKRTTTSCVRAHRRWYISFRARAMGLCAPRTPTTSREYSRRRPCTSCRVRSMLFRSSYRS